MTPHIWVRSTRLAIYLHSFEAGFGKNQTELKCMPACSVTIATNLSVYDHSQVQAPPSQAHSGLFGTHLGVLYGFPLLATLHSLMRAVVILGRPHSEDNINPCREQHASSMESTSSASSPSNGSLNNGFRKRSAASWVSHLVWMLELQPLSNGGVVFGDSC